MTLSPISKRPKESVIEKYLVKRVQELGGFTYPLKSASNRSKPDRLCVFPYIMAFAEVKRPGADLTKAQEQECLKIDELGHIIVVVSTKEEVDEFINIIKQITISFNQGSYGHA